MTEIDTSTAAIAALMDGVTPGPWNFKHVILCVDDDVGFEIASVDGCVHDENVVIANGAFIAASRELVPALAAERDALKAEVDLLLWPPLCGQPKITDVYQILDSADRAHAAMCRSLEMTSTLVGDMAAAIRELRAERDAAVARAAPVEARVAELEAEVERLMAEIADLDFLRHEGGSDSVAAMEAMLRGAVLPILRAYAEDLLRCVSVGNDPATITGADWRDIADVLDAVCEAERFVGRPDDKYSALLNPVLDARTWEYHE